MGFFLQQATKSNYFIHQCSILYGIITIADCIALFFGSFFYES